MNKQEHKRFLCWPIFYKKIKKWPKIGLIIAEDFSLTHFPRQVCQYLPRNGVTVSNDAASWRQKLFRFGSFSFLCWANFVQIKPMMLQVGYLFIRNVIECNVSTLLIRMGHTWPLFYFQSFQISVQSYNKYLILWPIL